MPDYFVPGYGISRRVIQTEIQCHCGPEATARPYVYQVSLIGWHLHRATI